MLNMASGALSPARALRWLDARLGRGSYPALKERLDPAREYTQLIYGRLLSDLVNGEVNWLDAGCGARILEMRSAGAERETAAAARLSAGCDLVLPALRAHRTLVNRVCCDVRALPFRDRSFQLVSLNNVAEHLEEPVQVFGEIARVLDAGARLVIHTPNAAGYFVRIVRLGKRILPRRLVRWLIRFLEGRGDEDIFPTYYSANTRAALTCLAHEAGMAVESVSLLPCRPLFYFAAPLSALELVATRALIRRGFAELGAIAILAVFRRQARRTSGGDA
jgi:SAM-dependent methyltransferase